MLKKVLIVDDSQAESRLMQSFLQGAGYAAVSLNDPVRLEQMLASEHPNLILLDVVMPGRNECRRSAQPSSVGVNTLCPAARSRCATRVQIQPP